MLEDSSLAAVQRLGSIAGLLAWGIAQGCGARSDLPVQEDSTDLAEGGGGERAERICLPTCTIGNTCCRATCDGSEVPLPSACCSCLPGEVDADDCPGNRCGG